MADEGILGKVIDRVFAMKRESLYLILILALGFVLRLIAAINLSVDADEMHFVTHAINFFGAGRLVTYDQSSGLWFAFTSIMYNLFGMTQLASRIAPILFGSLSILVIYLLTREFFSDKTSLIAAFLLAISPFHIKNTLGEMDVMAIFFVLLGMLLFIRGLKKDKVVLFALSGLFIGLAVYTKVYPLLFVPSLVLFFIYFKRKEGKKIFSGESVKKIFVFMLLIFIFSVPALTHNILLYKDKGFMDLQFTRATGIGEEVAAEHYAWDPLWNDKNDWDALIMGGESRHSASGKPLIYIAVGFVRYADPLNFYLGALGLLLLILYRKRFNAASRSYLWFFLFGIVFALPYLGSIILLSKHYIFLLVLLIPAGAVATRYLGEKISKLVKGNGIKILILIMLVFSLVFLGLTNTSDIEHFYGRGSISQMIDFKENNIGKNDLIVGDSRIYRGRINWAFQGRPYLEGSDFINVLNNREEIEGSEVNTDVYYFECVVDDCGWGTVASQKEFNASMESLSEIFRGNGELVGEISEPIEERPHYPLFTSENEVKVLEIYKVKMPVKQSVLEEARKPRMWFLYDIGYQPKEAQFDYYRPIGFGVALDKIAHWVVLLALILAFLSPVYVLHLVWKR